MKNHFEKNMKNWDLLNIECKYPNMGRNRIHGKLRERFDRSIISRDEMLNIMQAFRDEDELCSVEMIENIKNIVDEENKKNSG